MVVYYTWTTGVCFVEIKTFMMGGVLIAVSGSLKPKLVDLSIFREEVIVVKIHPNTIVCCYYRSHVGLRNTSEIDDFLEALNDRHQQHNILFVEDMNFLSIDWIMEDMKQTSQH